MLGLSLIFDLSTKMLGFTMVLFMKKTLKCKVFLSAILSNVLMSSNCCLKASTQKYIVLIKNVTYI